jgi:hypothetical protein
VKQRVKRDFCASYLPIDFAFWACKMKGCLLKSKLFGAKYAVPGIAQSRQYVTVLIQLAVNRSGVDMHIGMGFAHVGDAFRAGE